MVKIDEVIQINREKGHYFFSRESMKYFNSKIETSGNLIDDRFFITSEQFVPLGYSPDPRRFTVREFFRDTGSIETVGDFKMFGNKQNAKEFAKCMAKKKAGSRSFEEINSCKILVGL